MTKPLSEYTCEELIALGFQVLLNRGNIPQRLHDSEINFSLACFYDSSWTVKLGDDMNGFSAEAIVHSYEEALVWLDTEARSRYPNSFYVTGKYPEGWRPDGEISAKE